MTKQQLRDLYKKKRKELTGHTIEKYNDLILINFQKIMLPFIDCVHTYLASLKLKEVDTAKLIQYLQFKNPHLKIAVPKLDIRSGKFLQYHFDEETELIQNGFGIDEPKGGNVIREKEIDLVLVPLLAFDSKGFRVGYGKGYYDKFLSLCKPNVIKVGLSFFDPVKEIDDIDHYDLPLDYCVTPNALFDF